MNNKYFIILVAILPVFILSRYTFSQTLLDDKTEYTQESNPANSVLNDLSGDFSIKYKGRRAQDEKGSDQDFSESLRLRYGKAYEDKITGYLHGTLRQDLDDPSSFFRSIDDTYGSSIRGYLYEFYSVIKDVGFVNSIKIGRQYSNEVEDMHFDGLNLTFTPFKNVRLSSYGGKPVYFYESGSDGDWIGGLSAEVKPLKNSTVRVDYISSADNNSDFGNHHDNLLIFSLRQIIKPWWNIYGRYSTIDSVSRDIQLTSSWNFPSINLDVQFAYYKQPQTLNEFTVEFDEFVPLMGGYEPYDQYTFDIYKGLGNHMGVNVGLSFRELKDESDESSFNHDYQRYYISYSLFDLFIKGLTISATAEDYESSGDDVQTLSFDTTYKIKKNLRVSLGTYYSLFKYDTSVAPELIRTDNITNNQFLSTDSLTELERDNVRSYYIKAKKKLFDRWELSGDYEFEMYDNDTFHTVKTQLKLKF